MSRWKKDENEITENAMYMRDWIQTETGLEYKNRQKEYAKEWRKKNHEKFLATQRRCYRAIRLEALQHYSGKEIPDCCCCGETEIEFLQIDHAKGDGAAHRRVIGMAQGVGEQKYKVNIGGNGFVYWLKKNNWPEGFQVRCANCNYSKRIGKYCVHELKRGIDVTGETIPVEFYPDPPNVMPVFKSPERTAWLESPEGQSFREKQSVAHVGKMTGEDHPNWKGGEVEVRCAECDTPLKRKQCEVQEQRNQGFFCNAKCAGKWRSKNFIGDKIYNTTPNLEFECPACHAKILRKRHQLRPGQTKVYCNKACADAAKVGRLTKQNSVGQ